MAGPSFLKQRAGAAPAVAYNQAGGVPWNTPQTFVDQPGAVQAPPGASGTPNDGVSLPQFLPVTQPAGVLWGVYDPTRYPVVAPSVLAIPTASVLVLNRPAKRRVILGFRNSSAAANVYIEFGTKAATSSFLKLAPDQQVMFDTAVPQNDIYAVADAAAGQLSFIYADMN